MMNGVYPTVSSTYVSDPGNAPRVNALIARCGYRLNKLGWMQMLLLILPGLVLVIHTMVYITVMEDNRQLWHRAQDVMDIFSVNEHRLYNMLTTNKTILHNAQNITDSNNELNTVLDWLQQDFVMKSYHTELEVYASLLRAFITADNLCDSVQNNSSENEFTETQLEPDVDAYPIIISSWTAPSDLAPDCDGLVNATWSTLLNHSERTQYLLKQETVSVDQLLAWACLQLILALTLCPLLVICYIKSIRRVQQSNERCILAREETTFTLENKKVMAEQLLHRLLPPAIAHDLTTDKSVLAESYQSVTIYFSDIVGFTSISAGSTPLQVVTFLNKLYTEFDNRLDIYDVYKVETIGDAYMLVSGCPRTNGIRHAGEIATMALDLLNMVNNFTIPHLPEKKLMLRIGVHSGPCVAAVVGEKMPRYCLFGDTVNIASRIEATGQAMRIQITQGCKDLLDQLGRYDTEERGQVEVKESMFLKTYWLTGKSGYNFNVIVDVCVFIPKKVKLERVVVKKSNAGNSSKNNKRDSTNSQYSAAMTDTASSEVVSIHKKTSIFSHASTENGSAASSANQRKLSTNDSESTEHIFTEELKKPSPVHDFRDNSYFSKAGLENSGIVNGATTSCYAIDSVNENQRTVNHSELSSPPSKRIDNAISDIMCECALKARDKLKSISHLTDRH